MARRGRAIKRRLEKAYKAAGDNEIVVKNVPTHVEYSAVLGNVADLIARALSKHTERIIASTIVSRDGKEYADFVVDTTVVASLHLVRHASDRTVRTVYCDGFGFLTLLDEKEESPLLVIKDVVRALDSFGPLECLRKNGSTKFAKLRFAHGSKGRDFEATSVTEGKVKKKKTKTGSRLPQLKQQASHHSVESTKEADEKKILVENVPTNLDFALVLGNVADFVARALSNHTKRSFAMMIISKDDEEYAEFVVDTTVAGTLHLEATRKRGCCRGSGFLTLVDEEELPLFVIKDVVHALNAYSSATPLEWLRNYGSNYTARLLFKHGSEGQDFETALLAEGDAKQQARMDSAESNIVAGRSGGKRKAAEFDKGADDNEIVVKNVPTHVEYAAVLVFVADYIARALSKHTKRSIASTVISRDGKEYADFVVDTNVVASLRLIPQGNRKGATCRGFGFLAILDGKAGEEKENSPLLVIKDVVRALNACSNTTPLEWLRKDGSKQTTQLLFKHGSVGKDFEAALLAEGNVKKKAKMSCVGAKLRQLVDENGGTLKLDQWPLQERKGINAAGKTRKIKPAAAAAEAGLLWNGQVAMFRTK